MKIKKVDEYYLSRDKENETPEEYKIRLLDQRIDIDLAAGRWVGLYDLSDVQLRRIHMNWGIRLEALFQARYLAISKGLNVYAQHGDIVWHPEHERLFRSVRELL